MTRLRKNSDNWWFSSISSFHNYVSIKSTDGIWLSNYLLSINSILLILYKAIGDSNEGLKADITKRS